MNTKFFIYLLNSFPPILNIINKLSLKICNIYKVSDKTVVQNVTFRQSKRMQVSGYLTNTESPLTVMSK
jgi:hypothetical protein